MVNATSQGNSVRNYILSSPKVETKGNPLAAVGNLHYSNMAKANAGMISPSPTPFLKSNNNNINKNIDETPVYGGDGSASGISEGSLPSNLADVLAQLQAASAANSKVLADAYNHQNKIAMDFNAAEAAKNRSWQEYMSNSAHQREVADLQAAGLNPVLSATGGNGAAVTSGATAGALQGGSAGFDVDTSLSNGLAGLAQTLVSAEASMHNANVSAAATLGAANTAAGASKYSADTNAAVQRLINESNVAMNDKRLNASVWNTLLSGITHIGATSAGAALGAPVTNYYGGVYSY